MYRSPERLRLCATFRVRTRPVSVGFTDPTVTHSDWSAQKALADFMEPWYVVRRTG